MPAASSHAPSPAWPQPRPAPPREPAAANGAPTSDRPRGTRARAQPPASTELVGSRRRSGVRLELTRAVDAQAGLGQPLDRPAEPERDAEAAVLDLAEHVVAVPDQVPH